MHGKLFARPETRGDVADSPCSENQRRRQQGRQIAGLDLLGSCDQQNYQRYRLRDTRRSETGKLPETAEQPPGSKEREGQNPGQISHYAAGELTNRRGEGAPFNPFKTFGDEG